MCGAIPPLPNTPSWRGAELEHRDNFTFTFTDTGFEVFTAVKVRVPMSFDAMQCCWKISVFRRNFTLKVEAVRYSST
jgi:hypothetical protein